MKKYQEIIWLIRINLVISTFTFGGGYVVVPMIRKYYVGRFFTEEDLLEMAAIAQSSPGAIALNLCVLAGKKAYGKIGFWIAFICGIIPPLVIIGVISQFYVAFAANKIVQAVLLGMQAAVAALILEVVVDMVKVIRLEKKSLLLIILIGSFFANAILQVNVVLILVVSSILMLLNLKREAR